MNKVQSVLFGLAIASLSFSSFGQGHRKAAGIGENVGRKQEKVVGNILKNALETYHYRDMRIDDGVSQKAFVEFLKKVDYGKQFLLESDRKKLSAYQFQMDNQMVNGDHKLLDETTKIFEKRIKEAEAYRVEVFKKAFSFDKNEELELDPKKRTFPKNEKAWKEHWRKIYKQAVLGRYLSFIEGQRETKNSAKEKIKKKGKSKKKKKEKKLTDKEMRKKSQDAISKKYKRFFARLLKDDRTDYLEKFFNSLTNIYDPHTLYLPPKRKEDFDIEISGQLEGIGAVLQEDGAFIKVVKVVPGGAAWRQKGLEVDDVILMVGEGEADPVDLVDMRVDDAVRYIRGKKGSEVRLTVKKIDGTKKVIPIVRDVVQMEASYAKSSVLEHKKTGSRVGYIHVPKFYRDFGDNSRNCSKDVKEELERLKKQNINGVILDLRNNGGGALEDARIMSGLFIPKGPIVQTKNYTDQIEVLRDTDPSVTYDGPLIVMTNRFSASASEILAGALQDYKRAVIVGGEYSHGKGTVQAVLPLNAGIMRKLFGDQMGALKVTIQKFYRISGESTQYKGVTPDIIIPDPMAYSESREKDLEYSLPWDKVKKLNFTTWKKNKFSIKTLKHRSEMRVKKDKRFKKITESVNYLIGRRKDTVTSLNIKKVMKEDEENKKISEKLKMDVESKDLIVSHYEASVRSHEKVTKGEEKKWKEDFKQRKEDWEKGLRQDAGVEEALFIMEDMIKQTKGQKLSFYKK